MRPHASRTGQTLLEFLVVMGIMAFSLNVALNCGHRFGWYGYPLGFIGGALGGAGVALLAVWLFCRLISLIQASIKRMRGAHKS